MELNEVPRIYNDFWRGSKTLLLFYLSIHRMTDALQAKWEFQKISFFAILRLCV